jgi:RHS repeat-associated protein
LLTEEGYVNLSDGKYYYYLKDHQGNNRVVVKEDGTVQETNHYYPFGGVFASTGNVQPYKYNGKELDTKKGLNWYDYGARHYDATLGRFMTQDRFAEKYSALSPYQYGANNPVCNVDVNGDSLTIVGKMNDLNAVVATFNVGLGGFYATSVDNNGKMSMTQVQGKNINKISSHQKAYYNLLDKIINGADGMTSINVENGSTAIIGDVNTGTIDIGDIQALGSGADLNQESALLHETVEQYEIQVKGKSSIKAHLSASGAERLVTGSYIDPINRPIGNGQMLVPVLDPTGKTIRTIIVSINEKGNVTGIKR